jgi:hypothetical protein
MKIEMAKEIINKEIDTLLEYAINVEINKRNQNYVSLPWINMDVCGNIHICINDTFDFDKTSKVLKELKKQ